MSCLGLNTQLSHTVSNLSMCGSLYSQLITVLAGCRQSENAMLFVTTV